MALPRPLRTAPSLYSIDLLLLLYWGEEKGFGRRRSRVDQERKGDSVMERKVRVDVSVQMQHV